MREARALGGFTVVWRSWVHSPLTLPGGMREEVEATRCFARERGLVEERLGSRWFERGHLLDSTFLTPTRLAREGPAPIFCCAEGALFLRDLEKMLAASCSLRLRSRPVIG